MTLESQQVYKIVNKTPKVEKNWHGGKRGYGYRVWVATKRTQKPVPATRYPLPATSVLGPVYVIPARRDGMLTEIPLIIQILKSVYMIPPLIPPRRDLDNRCRDPA